MELFTRPDDVTESAGGSNNVLVRLPIKKLLYHGTASALAVLRRRHTHMLRFHYVAELALIDIRSTYLY